MIYSNSNDSALFREAQKFIPGGVNSPVRAFKGVEGDPIFFERAQGAYLYTKDGRQFIDYVGSWGPMVVGHCHPQVIAAVCQAAQKGLSFGAPTHNETKLAQEVQKLMPCMELIRFVNSGTEATMSAVRLARAFTGRNKLIKFAGCYHGHADPFLVKGGSGMLTLGNPSSLGVPESFAQHTLNAEFNNLSQVAELLKIYGTDTAAIIIEPIAGNMNCIKPVEGFLSGLRQLADDYGCVLIFDEVMTGFRVAKGGAQELYQITPDLVTIGKVVGGGMPVGAFGGKSEIMEMLAPLGSVYQAGTLAGNPIGTAAGIATLQLLQQDNFYEQLSSKTEHLMTGFSEVAKRHKLDFSSNYAGGMFGFFAGATETVTRFSQVASFVSLYKQIFHQLLAQGVYLAPSAYEAGFISQSHSEQDIDLTIKAFDISLANIKSSL